MSRVFVATDVALARSVVIKVLPPESTASVSIDRFQREIALAARLQHAHIVPVFSAGSGGNLAYFMMPFVDGSSLRQRLIENGPLPVPEAVRILREVASALAYAHGHGVVHRDIKPDNILVSGGAAMVTDFGIAKAIVAARTEPGYESLTQAGVSVGTPAYMAPEQVAAQGTADHRADIYSFGCLAYELLTGWPPFHGVSVQRLFAAHMTQAPVPVEQLRRDVPPALASLVGRCLEKDPNSRPQSATEILATLDSTGGPAAVLNRPPRARRRSALVAGATLVVVAALWAYAMERRASGVSAAPGTLSLAVLPFANIGGDSAQEYLADGMTDELTTAVEKLPDVRVASRTTALHYGADRRDLDLSQVGRALRSTFLVQGSVRRSGGRLKVSAQLTNAQTGQEVWAETFERDAKDVFAVQDEIARSITDALKVRFVADARRGRRSAAQGTRDPVAYDLYLRGQYALRKRDISVAADNFQSAIRRDPEFGRAYAGLADALELFPFFERTPAAVVFDRATAAAKKALAIDGSSAEARTALGLAYESANRWDEASAEFQRALVDDSNDVTARFQYGRYLLYVGKLQPALAEFNRAKALDPFFATPAGWLAYTLSLNGQTSAARAEFQRALDLDSTMRPTLDAAAEFTLARGDTAEAFRLAQQLPHEPPWMGVAGYVYGVGGDREAAQRIARSIEAQHPRPWFGETALGIVELGLGDTARALDAFERATTAHEIWPVYEGLLDPMFDPLRGSARFAALLRAIGLENRGFTQPHGGRPN